MPGRKSKYTKLQTQEMTMTALDILNESPTALTISEICAQSPLLINQTSQKMARCLNDLVEMGAIEKTKNKSGRMLYEVIR